MIFLFVHIAKTAGSSVNLFFQHQFGEKACLIHQESNPTWHQAELPADLLDGVRFVSGHISYRALTARLAAHPLYTLTVLRDPHTHVVSHLAWIRHLKDPGHEKRLLAHPPFIQALAGKLAEVELSDSAALSALVEGLTPEEWRLLDNPQVRYLSHRHPAHNAMQEADVASALETLREIDTFGFVEDPQALFDSLAKAVGSDPGAVEVPHENAHGNRYGLDPDDGAQIQALMPLIQHDLALYRQAQVLHHGRQAGLPEARSCYRRRDCRGNMGAPNARGQVPGWAFSLQSETAAKLDVYLNQRLVTTIEAARPRKDLQEKFGRDCAFLLDLESIHAKVGDCVGIYFHRTAIELNGSPRQVPANEKSRPSGAGAK